MREIRAVSLASPVVIDASRQENVAPAISAIFTHLRNLTDALNSFPGLLSITCPVGANTEFPLVHFLSRIPVGYFVIRKDRACDIYDSRPGAWTNRVLYLKSTVASAEISLVVF